MAARHRKCVAALKLTAAAAAATTERPAASAAATTTAASTRKAALFDLRQNAFHLFPAEGAHGLALDVAE
jgi:hypothetical protein